MRISTRFRELLHHFVMRFYDNDLLSPDYDQLPGLAGLFGLLAAPGMILPLWLMFKYCMAQIALGELPLHIRDMMCWFEKFLFVGLSLTSVGAVTVLQWDALFPDRRDYLVLCPQPLRLRTIFAAKVCSLGILVGCFLAAVTSLTPALFPATVLGTAPLGKWLWFGLCHLVATAAACLFTFLAVVGIQGLFLNLLPYRLFYRISPWLQLVCLAVVLAQFVAGMWAFLYLQYAHPHNHWTVYASPPLWFLGLYQHMMGWNQPVFRDLAHIALAALAGAAALASGTYVLAYHRHFRRCLEAAAIESGSAGPIRRFSSFVLEALAGRRAMERGLFRFITITLGRSRKQRLYFGAYLGLALVLAGGMLATIYDSPSYDWLRHPNRLMVWVPYLLLLIVLPGLRHAFEIPAERRANWVFQMAEPGQARVLAAVRRVMFVLGILPVCGGLLPAYLWLWGPQNALIHTAVSACVALVARDALLLDFRKIPFTCTYVPARFNLTLWTIYIILLTLVLHYLSVLELWILRHPWGVAIPVAAWVAMLRLRAHLLQRETEPLLFDDPPDPVVRELNLA